MIQVDTFIYLQRLTRRQVLNNFFVGFPDVAIGVNDAGGAIWLGMAALAFYARFHGFVLRIVSREASHGA